MPVLTFERRSGVARDRVSFTANELVVAGWTGTDEKGLLHHIEELAVLGVPRPSSVPVFYRNAVSNVMQVDRLQVLGPDTSGEVEPVVLAMDDGLWLTVGSDHTDRKAEAMGIALSKQLCAKVIGTVAWRLDDVAGRWESLIVRAHATIDGKRVLYQEGTLKSLRHPSDLIARYAGGKPLSVGTVMMGGTMSAIGGIRPASRFEMELEDPTTGERITHAYDIEALPVVT
ncbi:DUF2848 domain-containing protein [Hyphomicrobium sp. CS1BSMeth3]|uniref:DUF2848 domain-containing protein n=1 Tax=Hyphomicrobium sp. CS1BSMeth3 TaxID=1892844 RepID=UPI0009F89FEB|nr:DUF2848 domain-containing protein [Hyphomicrobium sp. CS1BSMeth3]